jgi:hypothetical protein
MQAVSTATDRADPGRGTNRRSFAPPQVLEDESLRALKVPQSREVGSVEGGPERHAHPAAKEGALSRRDWWHAGNLGANFVAKETRV